MQQQQHCTGSLPQTLPSVLQIKQTQKIYCWKLFSPLMLLRACSPNPWDTSHKCEVWFNCHSAEVLLPNIAAPKHEGSPPEAQQALPVCSSTPTNPMSRADTHRRASTFSANRTRSRVFASLKQPAQKKTHQIPRISDMLFHKDTYTEAEQTNL